MQVGPVNDSLLRPDEPAGQCAADQGFPRTVLGSDRVARVLLLRAVPKAWAARLFFVWSRVLFPGPRPAPGPLGAAFWACLLVLAAVAGALLLPHLSYPAVEPDEGRYAEIGREMLRRGDWLVPHLYGEPYYDKPPLLAWLVAASLQHFGTHAGAARLVPAAAALGLVLATFLFGSRALGTRAGFLAALVLTLMAGFAQCGRFLVIDGVLSLFEGLALFLGWEAVRGRRLRWPWWVAAALCAALGVLTKGPVALVTVAPVLAAYVALTPGTARLRRTHWAAFLGSSLAVAAPWFLAVTLQEPTFARHFFLDHHLGRFFGAAYHAEPVWFYVPVLLVGCLPWSVLFGPLGHFLFRLAAAHGPYRPAALGFYVLWAGWCVLFFSLSRGKLPTYVLPALPALALLLGWYLDVVLFRAPTEGAFRWARIVVPRLIVAVLAVAWLAGNFWVWTAGGIPSTDGRVAVVVGVCLAGFLGPACCGSRVPPRVAWGICAVLGFVFLLDVSQRLVPAWSEHRSPLAAVRGLLKDQQAGVACLGDEWGSIPFQLDDDRYYLHTSQHTIAEMRAFLTGHTRNLLFVKGDEAMRLVRQLVPPGMAVTAVIPSGNIQVMVVEQLPGTVRIQALECFNYSVP